MLRNVPRALLAAVTAVTAAACAAGTAGTSAGDGGGSGRYQVLIPALQVQGGASDIGESVAEQLRSLIADMPRHTAVSGRATQRAIQGVGAAQLDTASLKQAAAAVNAELYAWGTIEQAGGGLQSDIRFIDIRTGDRIELQDVTGQNPDALAQAIFQGFQRQIEGILQAGFCNDYLSSQQFERALQNCDQALALAPQSTAALYGKATALYNLERYDESLATYQQLLELNPEHSDALLAAGLAASNSGQTEQASQYYQRYMELNPGDVQVRMRVAGDIAQAGDYVSAADVLMPANTPENQTNLDYQKYLAQVATAAGQTLQERGDEAAAGPYFEAALGAYEQVFATGGDSLDVTTLRNAIAVYSEVGQTERALQFAEQATARYDTVAGVWSTYASVLHDAERHDDEVAALERALELDPNLENGHIRIALALMDSGRRQEAIGHLRVAAEQEGNRENVARALFSLAADELRAGRWSQAEDLLEMAHGFAAADLRSEISFYWGLSLYRQGEAIAKANAQTGSAEEARRALNFFQEALPRLEASNHQQSAEVAGATRQYIANQEAIIEASG